MEENLSASIYELLSGEHSPALAEYLESQREKMGVSQRKFCLAAGIHRRSYQRILQGEAQTIDVMTFLKIAQFFNIDVEGLLQVSSKSSHSTQKRRF